MTKHCATRRTLPTSGILRCLHPHVAISIAAVALTGCGGTGPAANGGATTSPAAVQVTSTSSTGGGETLSFPIQASGRYGVRVQASDSSSSVAAVETATPVTLFTCTSDPASTKNASICAGPGSASGSGFGTSANTASSGYDAVTQNADGSVTGTTRVTSANLSAFIVTDVFKAGPSGGFVMTRNAQVAGVGNGADLGYNTQFAIGFAGAAQSITSYHFLAPGIWYDRNVNAATGAIGTDLTSHDYFFWRETRSGLPFLMIQDPSTGSALSIAHTGANGAGAPSLAAGAKENSADWVVDAASQYGSLGVQKVSAGAANPIPTLGFVYPAQEGDVTYIGGTQQKWVRRSSPVSAGASQSYTLAINLDRYSATSATQDVADFPTALQQTWRRYYGTFAPPISPDRSSVAFTDGIHLLNSTYQAQAATSSAGFPFNIPDVVAGTPGNYSFQMGYVGEQIPLAFQLLRYGTMSGDALSLAQGKAILDFWATQDPPAQSSGLPLPWFAPAAPVYKWVNQNCSSPIYLRMVGDGMEGMVAAAIYARQQPSIGPKPAWEKFASGFADWLATNQAADGSFARAYNPDGSVWLPRSGCEANVTVDGASKLNTTFPIRFLVSMYFATGNGAYAAAAQKAGAYALANIYGPTAYTGGITSRNALDREAGAQAVHAALALYDLAYAQGDAAAQSRWLAAARQAADYLETWQYAWNFPILDPTGTNPQYVFAGTKATSLDGTGVSTGGSYLGIASFDYYRLHLLTREDPQTGHYGQFALMLASNATLTTQLSGIASQQFGWRYNGLLTEATNLSGFSLGAAGTGWLPWLTNSQLDPLQRLTDVFGSASVATILANEADASTLSRYGARNHTLYPGAGSLGWSR